MLPEATSDMVWRGHYIPWRPLISLQPFPLGTFEFNFEKHLIWVKDMNPVDRGAWQATQSIGLQRVGRDWSDRAFSPETCLSIISVPLRSQWSLLLALSAFPLHGAPRTQKWIFMQCYQLAPQPYLTSSENINFMSMWLYFRGPQPLGSNAWWSQVELV